MQGTNIQAKLEGYIGVGATFRSVQEPAMNAIMAGKSLILVVMGTGASKSLLFMLLAYCVSRGTTIVVVPLVSLQGDLKRRCDESGITCRV
jgi:superfamily II DNA helicase RecQ